jgi:CubicO group peptidase (beta-lactamase class C family)
MPDRFLFRPAFLGLGVLALACGGDSGTGPAATADLGEEWQTASPASQGLDPAGISGAVAHAQTLPRLLSLLVVRNGVLVVEEYFNGNRADSLNDVRSVTKSVVSTLVGLALHKRLLPDLGGRLDEYLDPVYVDGLAAAKRAITFRDLITMSGGLEWHESDGVLPLNIEYNGWITSADPVAYLLARGLVAAPGTTFNYNSAGTHLMSVMLASAVGGNLRTFARPELFDKLGVKGGLWEVFPDGTANGGAGLRLRPRDFAKIGALWLQRGETGRERLLDPEYIDAATAARFEFGDGLPPLSSYGYGYSWWIARTPHGNGFFAWGFGGQFIFVVPSKSVVVVVTTEWRNAGALASQYANNGLDLIVNHVLPAVR